MPPTRLGPCWVRNYRFGNSASHNPLVHLSHQHDTTKPNPIHLSSQPTYSPDFGPDLYHSMPNPRGLSTTTLSPRDTAQSCAVYCYCISFPIVMLASTCPNLASKERLIRQERRSSLLLSEHDLWMTKHCINHPPRPASRPCVTIVNNPITHSYLSFTCKLNCVVMRMLTTVAKRCQTLNCSALHYDDQLLGVISITKPFEKRPNRKLRVQHT